MRKIIVFILTTVFCSCENSDNDPADFQWRKLGLDGKIVNELKIHNTHLYAATNSGLFRASIDNSQSFELLGFDNQLITTLSVAGDVIYVSVAENETSTIGKLYKSPDAGDTWEEIENNFGGEHGEVIQFLCADPQNNNSLYATGNGVIAKSEDKGVNWEPMWGEWGGFGTGVDVVAVNPNRENEFWAGGQGGIENGFLLKSNDGENWTEWYDLVDNPTVVKEIIFDDNDPDKVYVGFEGALLATENGGDTWSVLIDSEENRFFFGIGKSGRNPEKLFAGGWLKRFDDPQPLILYYSENDGDTWREERFVGEDFGGIYDLKVVSEENRDRLFLALFRGGVYEVVLDRD